MSRKVQFEFSNPDVGWVDLTVKFGEEKVGDYMLTNIWGDPIHDFIVWLERIIAEPKGIHTMYHDGEGSEYMFMFEQMYSVTNVQFSQEPDYWDYGLFAFDEKGVTLDGKISYAVCNTYEFVSGLYQAIRDFAERQENNEDVVDLWAGDIYGHYCFYEDLKESEEKEILKKFFKNLKSKKIEKYLKENEDES